MLSRLRLQNFKSFVDQEIELGPLVIMVGANASGKSNFLDAIRFLQGVGLGMTFTEILRGRREGGHELWPGIRGGVNEIATKGCTEFKIESTWTDENHHLFLTHRLELETAMESGPKLRAESVDLDRVGEVYSSRSLPMDDRSRVAAFSALMDFENSTIGSLLSSTLEELTKAGPESIEGLMAVMHLGKLLNRIALVRMSPSDMRGYVPMPLRELGSAGENLSSVLYHLCETTERKQELIDWLSELISPELVDLEFIETELQDVMIELVEPGGTKVSARSLSDGTLRFLGQLVALKTAEPGSILLIEEVDSGLHPQRVHLLVEALDTATRERGIQVIATTHSPLVLGALPEKALQDAVLCARSADEQGTVLRRLGDLSHFDEVAERRGADHLMATGWLERAL